MKEVSKPPSANHLLGTDDVGRDYLSRLLHVMRSAVFVSILVPVLVLVIGVALGTFGAYSGGLIDNIIMRAADVVMTIPGLLFALLINASVKEPIEGALKGLERQTGMKLLSAQGSIYLDYLIVFGALAFILWPGMARLVRGQILSLREEPYVMAARAVGARSWRIMLRHLVPNALGPVIVSLTFRMSSAMLMESSLSYLGVGIQPPGASLGAMIRSAMTIWRDNPHLIAVPALVLAIWTLAINFVGDGLNDALNPRQAGRL